MHERIHQILSFLSKELSCPICLCPLANPISTPCCHVFCRSCIEECFRASSSCNAASCALCKQKIIKRSLVSSEQLTRLLEAFQQVLDAYRQDTGGREFVAPSEGGSCLLDKNADFSASVAFDDLSQRFPPLQKSNDGENSCIIRHLRDYLKALRLLRSQ